MFISDNVAAEMGVHYEGVQVILPFEGNYSVRVADGCELPLARRTGGVQVTMITLWALEIIGLALVVLPGTTMCLQMVPTVSGRVSRSILCPPCVVTRAKANTSCDLTMWLKRCS